jgi:hypothetical protein
VEWVVREGWGQGGEMNQALYAHMNNKRKMKKNKKIKINFLKNKLVCVPSFWHRASKP